MRMGWTSFTNLIASDWRSSWATGSNRLSLILVTACGKKFHFLG
jgi:hypothetical protein